MQIYLYSTSSYSRIFVLIHDLLKARRLDDVINIRFSKTDGFHVALRLFSNRSQRTSRRIGHFRVALTSWLFQYGIFISFLFIKKIPGVGFEPTWTTRPLELKSNALTTRPPWSRSVSNVFFLILTHF